MQQVPEGTPVKKHSHNSVQSSYSHNRRVSRAHLERNASREIQEVIEGQSYEPDRINMRNSQDESAFDEAAVPLEKVNLDFGYDCGDEPSDNDEPEADPDMASSSDSDRPDEQVGTDINDCGPTDFDQDSESDVEQPVIVTGDVYLLGGNHALQSNGESTQTSSVQSGIG